MYEVFEPFYKFYADSKGYLNVIAFIKLCKDFGIFP